MGRPAAARKVDGKPDPTSTWPKLSISVRPPTRALLQAAATVSGVPMWRLVEDAVLAHLPDALGNADYRMAQTLARRIEAGKD